MQSLLQTFMEEKMESISLMREWYAGLNSGRKNVLLAVYLLGFAIFAAAVFVFPVLGVLVLFMYTAGALLFGYVTGDAVRSILAGTLSYVFLILLILLSIGMTGLDQTIISPFRFAGYHLALLFVLGVIGWMASKEEKLPRILALPLSFMWFLLFLSGIS